MFMPERKIAILGAGNGGHAMAAHKSLDGFDVNLYELPRFEDNVQKVLATKTITVEWPDREKEVEIHDVTTDILSAIEGVELIFVIMPAFGHKTIAEICAPHLEDGQVVILMPGSGGSLEFARILDEYGGPKDVTICECSTLPYGARLSGPAHVVIHIEALTLPTGVFPANRTTETIAKLKEVYPTITPATNVIEAALNNPNPIAHPAATLLSATRIEYSEGEFYLYKEGMTPSVARVFEALDRERHMLLNKLGLKFHHCQDVELIDHNLGETVQACYENILKTTMDAAFGAQSIDAGIQMRGPSSMMDRYITEDVPYGLVLNSSLGRLVGIPTPVTDSIIDITGAINRIDYWVEGRGLDQLGLTGMTIEQIQEYLDTKKKEI
jgi:opine dehydrogenase